MDAHMISFTGNGKQHEGYFSPAKNGGPGIIVLQEWWGVNNHIKSVCDRFSEAGFSALAPDVYNGKKTTSPDDAGKLMMALNIGETEKTLSGAIDALLAQGECTSKTVGTVGFCMGGQLSLFAAASNPEKVSACVDFYGIHPNVHPPFEKLQAPILGFFAERDHSVNKEVIENLSTTLEHLGKKFEFHTFPNTDHAFFNDTRPVYNKEAAEDAWKKMIAFFPMYVK